MQPCSREMNQELLSNHPQIQTYNFLHHQTSHFDPSSSHDDFLEQMFSTIPSSTWPDLNPSINSAITGGSSKLRDLSDETPLPNPENRGYSYDESANLASKLPSHQISGSSHAAKAAAMMLQQHFLMSRVSGAGDGNSSELLPMPLSMEPPQDDVADGLSTFKSHNPGADQALYNGFAAQTLNHPQHFQPPQSQNHGASGSAINQVPAGGSTGATAAQPRQRVRARRGQATDPHSIAERLRRERIAERMKALQELVPNANKTDKASMLDEIIEYVKFLQLQVKVLSMSRLGGAAAVAPILAHKSSEGGGDCVQASGNGGASSNESLNVTEHQVAKMMEEDMGSAMQYLQGKGLCLMPISLATAISTATCHSRSPLISGSTAIPSNVEGPSSPNMSALTVQSATLVNGVSDLTVKDAASISKP